VEVNNRLCEAIQSNHNIILDMAASWPQVTTTHDSKRYERGRKVPMRAAAMALALQRLEVHFRRRGSRTEGHAPRNRPAGK